MALYMLAAGALVSGMDTGFRAFHQINRYAGLDQYGEYRDMVLSHLPNQILANLLFQFTIPFAAGWVIARIMPPRKTA